jgi:hypothetical protein
MKRSLFGVLVVVVGATQGIAAQTRTVPVRVMIQLDSHHGGDDAHT